MGMEADDVHVDKELDGVIIYSSGINDQDVEPLPKVINLDPPSVDILDENAELQDCEVKKCNSDEAYEVKQLCEVEKCEQNLPGFNSEVNMSKEEDATSEHQKVTDGNKKRQACGKKATKPAIGNCKIKCTVPQPFALATEKRALYGIRPSGAESDNITSGGKPSHVRVSSHSSSLKQNPTLSPIVARKPLQPDNKKRPDEDNCSVASSTAATARKFKTTVASAPTFKSSERAERRKEFISKLEEKHQALEAEKTQCEARTKEETEAAIKQLRKSLMFKASPMPSFYNEGPPPKVELKKPPPTRAKSPKLGRRKSFSDAKVYDGGVQEGRHSFHIFRDSPTNRKSGTHVKNAASWQSREQSHRGGEMDEAFTSSKLIGERCMDIAVHS